MIGENYPEFVTNFFVINAPSFMSVLWGLLQSWVPERTAGKIKVWKQKAFQYNISARKGTRWY